MSETGIVIYSAIVGGYDVILPPRVRETSVRRILFSDRRPRLHWGWEWRPLPSEATSLSPALANRWCKFFAHRLFPEAEISIYMDGNIRLQGAVLRLVEEFRASEAALGLFAHPDRDNIYDEAVACVRHNKIRKPEERQKLDAQLDRYRQAGLPQNHGLTENSIIVRAHHHPDLPRAMELWWQELRHGTARDQISLPWVRHITGVPTKIWPWNFRAPNPYFLFNERHVSNANPRRRIVHLFESMQHDNFIMKTLHDILLICRNIKRSIY